MKPFKTLEEQIDILESRNLKFKDEEKTKLYLLRNNYYNIINCYSKFFISSKTNHYYENVYFEDILEVYHFDKEIKHAVFKFVLEVERHFKSILAYNYAQFFKDDLYSYLNIKNYESNNYKIKNILAISNLVASLSRKINNKSKEKDNNSIKHYITNHNSVPFWILVDHLTFGEVTYFYKLSEEKIKNTVAKNLVYFLEENTKEKIKHEIPTRNIVLVLENILELRNITAHNGVLFNFKFRNDLPYLDIIHNKIGIEKEENRQGFYHTILYFQMFLTQNEYLQLKHSIKKRLEKLKRKIGEEYFNKIISSLGIDEKLIKIILENNNS